MPSHKTLYAFCQVAKYSSIKDAANYLNVSPSAVSHLIKSLEDVLEISLLERKGKVLNLTSEGRRLYESIFESFNKIDEVICTFQPTDTKELRISTTPSFFISWLSPKIYKFKNKYPEYEVNITGTSKSTNIIKESCDIAIRWFESDKKLPENLNVELLWHEELGCFSPSKWQGEEYSTDFSSFKLQPKVHAVAFPDHWKNWAENFSGQKITSNTGSQVETRANVIQAVVDGIGLAVVDINLVESELKKKQVFEPFRHRLLLESGYWIVQTPSKRETKQSRLFKEWLKEEMKVKS